METNHSRSIDVPTGGPPFDFRPMLPIVVVLLLVAPLCADAQPSVSTSDGTYKTSFNPSLVILIVVFICAFFFMGFFAVYIRRCAGDHSAISALTAAAPGGAVGGGRGAERGLDPAVLETFPTMEYAAVKKVKGGKVGALECAVCLSEFSDDDTLRLLPKCCHVFHRDCIDAWLASHVTCPVCRSNLADPAAPVEAEAEPETDAAGDAGAPVPPDHVAIDVEGEERKAEGTDLGPTARPKPPAGGFRRWNSEGRAAEGEHDRYTLRLPEHVQRELEAAGRLRRAASVAEYPRAGDAGSRRGNRGGVGRLWRSGRAGRSGRWGFFLRTFSGMRRGEGEAAEGSSKRVFPAARDSLDGVGGGGAGGSKSGSTAEGAEPSGTAGPDRV
ncbi:E3 ubiquitin-protein ligase Os03g0188200-like [Phoenix dactylifera]|uniref:RING-type E3 ubiquitin transferase n=1 Tax=Phoenix dactylifera TaxID=42345 RepID=A0A8B7CRN2_PHODC|nr:E3 ubiquitin-protein ligase Os03g0188200-like [Phoenix dactylifera]